ncbi:MAG: hypothetical protein NVSMB31_16980 [Vulcanimicrobiaceae bacterium]
MNAALMCDLGQGIGNALLVYIIIMVVYAVASWIPELRGRWTDYVAMLVEPVVAPVRRIIPPLGGFDLSFLIVMILLQVLRAWIPSATCAAFY